MALSVGELEATLKFKEEMSAALNALKGKLSSFSDLARDAFTHPARAAEQAAKDIYALSGTMSGLELAIVGVVSGGSVLAGALAYATYQAIEHGAAIHNMSEKMALSVSSTAALDFAMQSVGSSIDTASNLIYVMQQRMAASPDDFERGLSRIGLSMSALEALQPDEQLFAIAEAMQLNTDRTNRAATSFELFGRQGRDAIPTLMKPLQELSEEFTRLHSYTAQDVADAELLELAWNKTKTEMSWMITGMGVGVIQFFKDVGTAINGAFLVLSPFAADIAIATKRLQGDLPKVRDLIGHLTDKMDDGRLSGKALARAEDDLTESVKKNIDAYRRAQDAVAAVDQRIREATRDTGHLTQTQEASIRTYHDLGISNTDIATKLGVSAIAVDQLEASWARDEALTDWIAKMATASARTDGWRASLKGLSADLPRETIQYLQSLSTTTEMNDLAFRQLVASGNSTGEALQRMGTVAQTLPGRLSATTQALDEAHRALDDDATATDRFFQDLSRLSGAFAQLAQVSNGSMGSLARSIGTVVSSMSLGNSSMKMVTASGATMTDKIVGLTGSIAALDQSTSGGGVAGILGGAATGAAIGAAFGGIGAPIGMAAGAVYGLAKSLFSVSEEEKKARAAVAKFEQQLDATLTKTQRVEAANRPWAATTIAVRDAYLTVGRSAAQAEQAVNDLWDSSRHGAAATEAATKAIQVVLDELRVKQQAIATALDHVQAAASGAYNVITPAMRIQIEQAKTLLGLTDEQKAALDRLTSSGPDYAGLTKKAEGYGIALQQLGPQFEQAHLSATAQQIVNDFIELNAAGADVNGLLIGMQDEVQGVLDSAWQFGGAIPEAMRPMIEEMAAAGLLTDQTGQKLHDLAGVRFQGDLTTSLDTLTKSIQGLIDALTGRSGVTDALDTVNRIKLNDKVIHVIYNQETLPPARGYNDEYGSLGGLVTATGIQRFARGGAVLPFVPRGTDTVPAMLTPGERVLSVAQNQAYERGAAIDLSAVVRELRELKSEMRWQRRTVPSAIRDALQRSRAS